MHTHYYCLGASYSNKHNEEIKEDLNCPRGSMTRAIYIFLLPGIASVSASFNEQRRIIASKRPRAIVKRRSHCVFHPREDKKKRYESTRKTKLLLFAEERRGSSRRARWLGKSRITRN